MRVTTRNQVLNYNKHIFAYAEGLKVLYPDAKLRPSLHGALHIGDILELFGPVQSHSAPFFERYINFFHRINTNQKLGKLAAKISSLFLTEFLSTGELELTFMALSSRNANLRAILADDDDVRESVIKMIQTIESIGQEDSRGSRLASLLDPTSPQYTMDVNARPIELEGELFLLLCELIRNLDSDDQLCFPPQGLFVRETSLHGVCFGTADSSTFRNSRIMFNHPYNSPTTDPRDQKAGLIESIFQYKYQSSQGEKEGFYVAVRQYNPVVTVHGRRDVFRAFGFAGGFLCQPLPEKLHVISLSSVVSHFAFTEMSGQYENYIHVMPVDRVCRIPL